jgi:hypothetical protein
MSTITANIKGADGKTDVRTIAAEYDFGKNLDEAVEAGRDGAEAHRLYDRRAEGGVDRGASGDPDARAGADDPEG